MIDDKLTKEKKEFYIKKVEKYNSESNSHNRAITLNLTTLGLSALYFIFYVIRSDIFFPDGIEKIHLIIGTAIISGTTFLSLKNLINKIIKKIGLESRISEIEELLESYKFNLTEENKEKGRNL